MCKSIHEFLSCPAALGALALLALTVPLSAMALEAGCGVSATLAQLSCEYDVHDERYSHIAQCQNATTPDPACLAAADAAAAELAEECGAVLEGRLALCAAVDDEPHDPAFGPAFAANFVDPGDIGGSVAPNPWFSLVTGNTWVYEGAGETITVTVTDRTKLIDGITCVTVNDVAMDDGVVVEITDDWYAQDISGNVWYCGEIAQNFESFDGDDPDDPELVDVGGSWKHGREGAKAGILLPAVPEVGATIRQELLLGDAEDVIEILSITATETSTGGSCTATCLQTRDFAPLEPEANEHKFYAPGLGLIVEIDTNSGDRVELVEFTAGAG